MNRYYLWGSTKGCLHSSALFSGFIISGFILSYFSIYRDIPSSVCFIGLACSVC